MAPQVLTQEEITTRVTQDLQNLTTNQEPIKGPIDLYEAIARALQYNLDTRVEVMKTMLAHQQLDVSHYNMLPRLVANAVYDGRDKFSGATSRSLLTGQTSLEPSTSSDLHVFTTDLTLSWDILDFGLSYVRAQQAADDVLMAEEVKRRVANRVIREVRTAYWRAVIAKRALPRLGYLGRWVSRALTASRKVLDRRLNSPLASLQYQRELLATQHEIQKLYQKFATAHLDLARLMNIVPGTPYELVNPKAKLSIPEFNIHMAKLEKQALSNRPELRTIDYQKRINAKETKAAILEMLPNLNLKVGPNYSSNS
ncbi:MAG: TolC family protein, partial [Nitrospirota bacterium]|nr:TolC family protein [Nitrospirota bacterium]